MRNLSISEVKQNQLNVDAGDKICVICMGHSEGQASTKIYICTLNLNVVHFDDFDKEVWRKSLADFLEPGNLPVDITYLTLLDSMCLALSHGDIVSISGDGSLLERVGVCSNGILAAEWSPDQELLVVVTKALKTLLMPYTFDPPAHEVNLLNEEFGEKQFVTVGWGKKETQFHGSEGKHARVKNEVLPDNIIADTEETVKVTWRGDGQLYAIGFTYEGLRRFKVFDREGQLQYTSEKQPGLQANMSWRPSGNVIATTQKLQDKYLVAFFEKNGLKHGDFTIPVNCTTTVENISWSYNSEILALQCLDASDNTQNILIFTTSNYHWYLKQILKFEKHITKMVWDNDFDVASHKKLHIILKNGEHYIYNWLWNVDHSCGQTDEDDGIVAVIDGKQILLTGFRQTIIPPPMAALTLTLDFQINSIHFSRQPVECNNFFVCTAEEKLIFYNQSNKHPLAYEAINSITLDKYKFPFQYFNMHWVNRNTIISIKIENGEYSVVEFEINGKDLVINATTLLACCVMKVHPHPKDLNKIFLQLNNGEIMQYSVGGEISPLDVLFPVPCPMFSVIEIESRIHFLGLSYKNNFYIDDALVLNNVNSFYVHTHFLILTTLSHFIFTIELTNAGLNAIKDYKKIESPHVYKRKVERGSRLVIAVPNDTRTILQMPRGNLEAIQPRPLSLIIIGKYLDNQKYYEAFDLMRKQRINLNLIYDHDPEKFSLNVDAFLESIQNNSWLSLFLSDLENTDTTTTMYTSSYPKRAANSNNADKVVKVCDVIRERLKSRADSDSKVLPLITTYVKKNTMEDLEIALTLIMKMKEQESAGAKLPVSSDEALKYLLYMVDVSKLFDIALGMYEFDLVVLVANKSQKDPKDYVSMLNEFNEMEDNYKKFSVNKHLKRFDRAVECLAKCGTSKHEELRNFVKYHSLYKKALEMFNSDDTIFKEISEDFGSYLRLQKQNIEAGLIYRRAKNYNKAIECFRDALEWELAIEIAINHLDKSAFLELCWDLVNELKQEKRHHEAIAILDSYYGNPNETILYCVGAGFYRSAMRFCSQYRKCDLKEDKLRPKLMEEYESLNSIIEGNWCTFIRYKDRLRIVREKKRTVPIEQYDPSQENRDCDLYSDAGSTIASSASRSSSRTYRSSKNRRKHERKVASLKEGSQYEDVALVMALHTLVTSSFELRSQVREVNVVLTCFGEDLKASTLQRSLDKLLKDMRESFRDIWTNELVLEATNAAVAALDVPEGCSVVVQGIVTLEPHLRIAPVIQEITWKLEGLD